MPKDIDRSAPGARGGLRARQPIATSCLAELATRRPRKRPFTCTVKTRRWFLPRLWAVGAARRLPAEKGPGLWLDKNAPARAAAGGMTS